MPGVAVGVGEHPRVVRSGPLSLRTDACSETVPELRTVQLGHRSRCLHVDAVTDPPGDRYGRRRRALRNAAPCDRGLRAEHRGRHGVLTVARDVSSPSDMASA